MVMYICICLTNKQNKKMERFSVCTLINFSTQTNIEDLKLSNNNTFML